jgi:hypothetical protein
MSPQSDFKLENQGVRSPASREPSEAVSGALRRLYAATECSCPPSLNAVRSIHWDSCRSRWRPDVKIIAEHLGAL